MSQDNPGKKKVVVTAKKKQSNEPKASAKATKAKSPVRKDSKSTANGSKEPLLMTKTNYLWMGAGIVLIALGLILMSGGKMPSPEVWDDSIIYSFRRVTLAPIFIIAGLVLQIVAIFKK